MNITAVFRDFQGSPSAEETFNSMILTPRSLPRLPKLRLLICRILLKRGEPHGIRYCKC
jgi:hypothetical protein